MAQVIRDAWAELNVSQRGHMAGCVRCARHPAGGPNKWCPVMAVRERALAAWSAWCGDWLSGSVAQWCSGVQGAGSPLAARAGCELHSLSSGRALCAGWMTVITSLSGRRSLPFLPFSPSKKQDQSKSKRTIRIENPPSQSRSSRQLCQFYRHRLVLSSKSPPASTPSLLLS